MQLLMISQAVSAAGGEDDDARKMTEEGRDTTRLADLGRSVTM